MSKYLPPFSKNVSTIRLISGQSYVFGTFGSAKGLSLIHILYIGGEAFGLRAKAKNFSMRDMEEGIAFAHAHGVKVYVTANILACLLYTSRCV